MKKISACLILCTMIFIISSSRADAAGFGFYGSYGLGSADWKDDYTFPKFSTDTQHREFGLTFDSGLSGRHLFNYHLEIGRETFTSKNFIARDAGGGASVTSDLDLDGIVISNTFGFGGPLSDHIRMWLGPEIRWHIVRGSPSRASGFDLDGAGFGFGPSLGLNFNLSSGLTIMLKAGYIMAKYSLDGEGYINNTYSSNSYDVDEEFTYLNLEFFFRTPGDR